MCRLLVLGLTIALGACQGPPSTPDQVYIAFHRAVAEQDWDRALLYLTPETKQALGQMGHRLAQAVGHTEDPLTFFLRGVRAQVHTPLLRVETLASDDARATVAVEAGRCGPEATEGECSKSEVVLLRRDGRWLIAVDLPAALAPGARQGGG